MRIRITNHARFEAHRRQIDEGQIRELIAHPQQRVSRRKGRVVLQRKYVDPVEGKEMLLRAVVEEMEKEVRVITVYKTSKVDKYWMKE